MQDKYRVVLYSRALRDLNGIYQYIFEVLQVPENAQNQLQRLEDGIFGLEELPYRCPERRTGIYARRGYRELMIDNYIVIFRVDESERQVQIVTVQYSKRNF